MLTIDAKVLKFKLYRELEEVYHRFFDELAQSDLRDGEIGRIAEIVLLSRQECFKHLLSADETNSYCEVYREGS
jgi:hercynine metabolism small protein